MPNNESAKKRLRQADRARIANKSVKSELRTLTKKLLSSLEAKDQETARAVFPRLIGKLDRAARKRVLHPNTVARQKSQLARLMNG